MAPRKKSKAKKLTETMRQRQMRLRAEQQAAKQRGGSLAKTTQSKPASTRVEKVKVKDVTPSKSKLQIKGGSAQKALPPGTKGGALAAAKKSAGLLGKVAGAAGVVGGMAAEVKEMSDRAKRDAERNKKLGRRPFEELRSGNRSTAKGGQGNRGRNAKPAASKPKATEKQIAALTQKGGLFYQGPGKPKPAAKKTAVSGGGGSKSTASKPKAKSQGQSKDMGENYRRWAAANPKLAAKVKKGQAGYAELKGSKKPSTPAPASKKGSTSPSSAVKKPSKSKPKPQNFLSLSERMKKKRGY